MPRQSAATVKKIDARPHRIGSKLPVLPAKSAGNEEDRLQMISEAAYYRALGRDFDGGDPMEDWLMAEAEIDSMPQDWEDPDSHPATID